ncbi:MAG: carbon monoxide dehydrogenase subunit G [Nitrososphaerota archaeon]|nr:carbon monoxide dehydrogenase subunit G [Nitrososphaerota archaeon]
MRYEGAIEAPIAREVFYGILSDPEKVIRLLPDVVESKVADQDHFTVKARVGAGPLRGTLDFTFETAEKKPDLHLKLRGRGHGMQSTVDLTLQMSLEDSRGGSKANWAAEAEVGGLLASVGGRLLDGIASKYMKQITENIRLEVSK